LCSRDPDDPVGQRLPEGRFLVDQSVDRLGHEPPGRKMDPRRNRLPVDLGEAVARRSAAKDTAAANSRAIEVSLA